VDWSRQITQSLGDGVTTDYYIGNLIQIDADTQLTISVAGDAQILGTDYTVVDGLTTVKFATAPATGDAIEILRTSRLLLDQAATINVTQSASSGSGTGAKFTVVYVRNQVGQFGALSGSVIISDGGSNYVTNDTITLSATSFGGNPANGNITLRVGSVDGNGAVQAFAALDVDPTLSGIVYTPIVLTSTFSLNEYLYTVNNIFSFSVLVDGVLQRPHIDYEFNEDSTATTAGGIDTPPSLVAVELLSAHVEHVRHVVAAVGVVVERHLAVIRFGEVGFAGHSVVGDPVTLADGYA
jgi:hypothetical protein